MPRFLFQVQQGRLPDRFALEDVLSDNLAARNAALGICADLARDIVIGLSDDSEWRLDVLDESGKAFFRIRLRAESLEQADTADCRAAFERRETSCGPMSRSDSVPTLPPIAPCA